MRALNLRSLLVAVVVYGMPAAVAAQLPTPQQAQQMLQSNPALVEQLRQRIMTSGMTPDQVRERLREEGYPENLLDSYLPAGTGTTGGTTTGTTTPQMAPSAIQELALPDTGDFDVLRCGALLDSVARADTTAQGGAATDAQGTLLDTFQPDTGAVGQTRARIRACRRAAVV